jgi:hypothetical protein
MTSPRSLLHVVRTVRRAGFVGKEAGTGAIGTMNPESLASMATNSLAIGVSAAENPAMYLMPALFGALIIAGFVGQFVQPQLGNQNPFVFPTLAELHQPQLYADQIRKMYLEKIHGPTQGDLIWNSEWNQRQISIDLRAKAP